MDPVLEKFLMSDELYERLTADQAKYRRELTAIVERTYQPTIVKNLLVLQSNSPPPTKTPAAKKVAKKPTAVNAAPPKWFARQVGELLSGRLVASSNGVAHVIRGVLDMGDAGATASIDWTKVELVANVLASPPEGNYASIETYYAQVCPQILRLIADSEDKIFQMIACAAVRTMAERSLILSRRYLLDNLMAPFLELAATDDDDNGEKTANDAEKKLPNEEELDRYLLDSLMAPFLLLAAIDDDDDGGDKTADGEEKKLPNEEELDGCLKTLYKVFVIGNDPSMMFVSHLSPIILLLLELHAAIVFAGVSHLVGPVKQLVQRYLKHSDRATAVATLRGWAFNAVPATAEAKLGRIKKMNQVRHCFKFTYFFCNIL